LSIRRQLMGQAKRRGTFEERKAQAIKEGREKKEKPNRRQVERQAIGELMEMLGALFGGPASRRRR